MRVVYRQKDNLVLWVEADGRQLSDYLEPIWYEELRQAEISGTEAAKTPWRILTDRGVEPALIDPPDGDEIRMWQLKARTLTKIWGLIAFKRSLIIPTLPYQSRIYRMKEDEAYRLQAHDYQGVKSPLVEQYAQLKGLSLKDACNVILMMAEKSNSVLVESEGLRLRLVHAVLESQHRSQLQVIQNEVHRLFAED